MAPAMAPLPPAAAAAALKSLANRMAGTLGAIPLRGGRIVA